MSLLYSKLRLQIPQLSDGKNAIITSPRGVNRSVPMTYPLTDVFVAGMDKYTVQAGVTLENYAIGSGKLKKIITEDTTAITLASMPNNTTFIVGNNLDLTGVEIDANLNKGDGTSGVENITSRCSFNPPNGAQLNTEGIQRVDVTFFDFNTFFNVVVTHLLHLKQLPYEFENGSAVVLNNEIHILGGTNNTTKHYKWDGTNWVSVSTLPYNFYQGAAVVLNDEIHLLGGQSNAYAHYKWNGSSWVSVGNCPYQFRNGSAVVLNNNLYLIGSDYSSYYKAFYKWNGTSWSNISDMPNNFYNGGAVVLNDEIHILGGSPNNTQHYKWNQSRYRWETQSTLPYNFYSGGAVVLNDEIHILGNGTNYSNHYKWDGTSWSSVSSLPYQYANRTAIVINGEIVILGSSVNNQKTKDAEWDGTSWTLGTS